MAETKLLVTFRTTNDAIKAEFHLEEAKLPGRLIPVPVSISSSCGFAWLAPPENKSAIQSALLDAGISPEGFHDIEH